MTTRAAFSINQKIVQTDPAQVMGDFRRRLPFIDGMRAISVILVLVSHIPYATDTAYAEDWIYRHGDLGVRVFFVLSGFLITGLLLTEIVNRSTINFLAFYKKRAFRLMPVYWAYLFVLALAELAGLYEDKVSSWFGAITYTRNIIGIGNSATVHFWSLAIEEQFYFLWPLLLIALSARSWRFLLIVMAVSAPLAILFRVNQCGPEDLCRLVLGMRSILLYMDSILVGCLAGTLWLVFAGGGGLIGSFWLRTIAVIVLLLSTTGYWPLSWPVTNYIQALLIGFYLYSALTQPTRAEAWLLENPIAVYLGKLSYSLYVWHILYLGYFNDGMFGQLQPLVEKYWLAIALLIAIASYHLLETPLRRHLNKRYLGRGDDAKAQAEPKPVTS